MNRIRQESVRRGASVLVVAALALSATASCKRGNGDAEDSDASPAAPSASAPAATASAAPPPAASGDADASAAAADEGDAGPAALPPGKCPEATSPERLVANFDWSKSFGVDAPAAAKLRGVSGTAVETRLFAGQVGNELRSACAGIAGELGNKGSFPTAAVACQAAVDALKATRAKLGPTARIVEHIHPALCAESLEEVKACEKRCTGDEQPPEASCLGPTVGRCQGTCDGP